MTTQTTMLTQVNPTKVSPAVHGGILQRKCACGNHTVLGGECTACRQKRLAALQRAAAKPNTSNMVPQVVHDVLRSPGQPLDAATQAYMESRFGHDFSQVRVHTDTMAAESAQAVNALAYTVGSRVIFGSGQYAPTTHKGQQLLAHELAHVVQQPQSHGIQHELQVAPANSILEREAEQTAKATVAHSPTTRSQPYVQTGGPAVMHRTPAGLLQRDQAPNRASQLGPCTEIAKLQAAVTNARQMAGNAVRGLEALLNRWGQPPANIAELAASRALASGFNIEFDKSLWVDPLGMDAQAVQAQDARDQAATCTILANFRQIAADLPNYTNPPACSTRMTSGQPCFGCVAAEHPRCSGHGSMAFVPPPFIGQPSSAILFCPVFFTFGPEQVGEMVLHESAHLQSFAARDKIGDVRYYGCPVAPIDPGPGLVEPTQFIGIADAYRCFVETQRTTTGYLRRAERAAQEARRIVNEAIGPQPANRP